MNKRPRAGTRLVTVGTVALLAVLGLMLPACSSDSGGTTVTTAATTTTTTPEPVSGGTLVWAEGVDYPDMDPQLMMYDTSWRIGMLVYETLLTVDENFAVVPGIAESWQQPSPATYVFTLRDGVTFSNGRPLTADDVVGSLQRLIDPATGAWWTLQLGPVTSVTALDTKTVQVELSSPWPSFPAALAHTNAAIMPMQELADGSFDPSTEMLGTGPFVLTEHIPDQSWRFERNPYYWQEGLPLLDGVEIRIIGDAATRIAALRDGSVDVASFGSPDAPALLEGIENIAVTVQQSSDMYILEVNAVNPDRPFSDLRIRQALAYALDREAIKDIALGGLGETTAITPIGLLGSCDPSGLPTYTRDVERARQLLSEANAEGLEFELMAPPWLAEFSPIVQVIQQSLAEAGMQATITTPEIGKYFEDVYTNQPGTFDVVVDMFTGGGDPAIIAQYLVPERIYLGTGFVAPDEAVRAAIDAQAEAATPEERTAALYQLCTTAAEGANLIPLVTKVTTIAVRTDRVQADIAAADSYDVYWRGIERFARIGQ